MKTLLTPKLDLVFKLLFTKDPVVLADLLNSVMELPDDRKILSVEVKNPQILPEDIGKKFIILDISAVDNTGRHYDIEMQVRKYSFYPKRSLFYLCRMYVKQLGSGREYDTLNPVVGIHFLDYQEYPLIITELGEAF